MPERLAHLALRSGVVRPGIINVTKSIRVERLSGSVERGPAPARAAMVAADSNRDRTQPAVQGFSGTELSHAAMEDDEDFLHGIIDVPRRQAQTTDDGTDEVALPAVHLLEARRCLEFCGSSLLPCRGPHGST